MTPAWSQRAFAFIHSEAQTAAISEGIVRLLLIDLRNRVDQLTPGHSYKCPFGLKPPQHPLILVLQKRGVNVDDVVAKIDGIWRHDDKR